MYLPFATGNAHRTTTNVYEVCGHDMAPMAERKNMHMHWYMHISHTGNKFSCISAEGVDMVSISPPSRTLSSPGPVRNVCPTGRHLGNLVIVKQVTPVDVYSNKAHKRIIATIGVNHRSQYGRHQFTSLSSGITPTPSCPALLPLPSSFLAFHSTPKSTIRYSAEAAKHQGSPTEQHNPGQHVHDKCTFLRVYLQCPATWELAAPAHNSPGR